MAQLQIELQQSSLIIFNQERDGTKLVFHQVWGVSDHCKVFSIDKKRLIVDNVQFENIVNTVVIFELPIGRIRAIHSQKSQTFRDEI